MSALFLKYLEYLGKNHPHLGLDVLFLLLAAYILLFFLTSHLFVHSFVLPVIEALFQCWSSRNLVRFAGQRNYQVLPGKKKWGIFSLTTMVETKHNGRTILLHHIKGRGGHAMMAVSAACACPADFHLSLERNFGWVVNALLALAKFLRKDIRAGKFRLSKSPTNEAAFDEAYVLKSNDPVIANSILTPNLRGELLADRGLGRDAPSVIVGDDDATYAISLVPLGNLARWEKLAEKITLVCALAKQAESRRA